MKPIEFDLTPSNLCPTIRFDGFEALFDTGAVIPVFSYSAEVMKLAFGATKRFEKAEIGGIGGKGLGDIYRLKDFHVSEFVFSELDVYVPEKRLEKTPILFSVTMFHELDYGVKQKRNKFVVEIEDDRDLNRSLTIEWLKGAIYPRINGVLYQNIEASPSDANYIQFLQRCAKDQQRFLEKLHKGNSR